MLLNRHLGEVQTFESDQKTLKDLLLRFVYANLSVMATIGTPSLTSFSKE